MLKRLSINNLLILINVAVFGLQQLVGPEMLVWFAQWPLRDSPYGEGSLFRPWQLLTYGFMHGSLMHLFFNMFGLYTIGEPIERLFGRWRYLSYYLVCVAGAAAFHMIVTSIADLPYNPMVGASGALFGVLLAFGMAFPHQKLMLMFLPIPISAWLFVTLYGAGELYMGVTQTLEGVAHFAHLGGMLTGFVMICYWRAQARRPAQR